ncbi:hypothetical protein LEP1GSC072_3365 [Leptospira noguchii str. Bonito]|nr:hypothetical protein LEP1GSC072_3365 [Leptospira noguchii str. Bonito]
MNFSTTLLKIEISHFLFRLVPKSQRILRNHSLEIFNIMK